MIQLYIANLALHVNEDDLRELISPFGTIESINLVRNSLTNESRGFALVDMSEVKDALEAIKSLENREFHNQKLYIREARPKDLSVPRDTW